MKTLKQFILEGDDKGQLTANVNRGDIKFTIWKSPDNKITDLDSLNDNKSYQKIEYKLEDSKAGISIDFLLGYDADSWKLWVGKIGSCSYDDDPYKTLNTDSFRRAIVSSIDVICDFVEQVKNEPNNYVQFYTHR